MASWNEGYVSQLGYTHGYYAPLNPLLLKLATLAHGYQPPAKQPLRYLELGFGQGLPINIHAAATAGEFWGNDFIPNHVLNAKSLASASGANLTLLEDSFAELIHRQDMPSFDIIALHGVWSWVSPESRQLILEIIRSKLNCGGILYISYNTTPGWSTLLPVRDLMMSHIHQASPIGQNMQDKINSSISFIEQLTGVEAAYFTHVPDAVSCFQSIKKDKLEYLAHELFNASWAPMSFSEVALLLSEINMSYAGPANVANIFAPSLLPEILSSFLNKIESPIFFESTFDFCVNQKFRQDIWIKGGVKLNALERLQKLSEIPFTLTTTSFNSPIIVNTTLGGITIDETIANPVFEALASNNFEPKTINDLLLLPNIKTLTLPKLCNLMLMLCGNYIAPTYPVAQIDKLTQTKRLNDHLMKLACYETISAEHGTFLASPITGGGVGVTRLEKIFLLALKNGFTSKEKAIDFVLDKLAANGQRMVRSDGSFCNNKEENIAALETIAFTFFESLLPILKALKIA